MTGTAYTKKSRINEVTNGICITHALNPILTIFGMSDGPPDMLSFKNIGPHIMELGEGQNFTLPIDKAHCLYNSLLLQ